MCVIKTKDELKKIADKLRNENKKIVFTNGCFDIIHPGHIIYLKKAKSFGDILIVGINSDSSVKKLKGDKRPVQDEKARSLILSSLKPVDYCYIFNESNPIETIKMVKPDIHVKGGDYDMAQIIEKDAVEKNGGKVILVQFEDGFSSTSIIDQISNKGTGS